MKKTLLISLIIGLGSNSLFAQSKKADSTMTAKADKNVRPYTLTHKDSLLIKKWVESQSQPIEEQLPVDRNRFAKPPMTDVIDVGHDIK